LFLARSGIFCVSLKGSTFYLRMPLSSGTVGLRKGFEASKITRNAVPSAGKQSSKAPALRNKPNVYRVIYRVGEKQKEVEILYIRHGARQHFKTGDLK